MPVLPLLLSLVVLLAGGCAGRGGADQQAGGGVRFVLPDKALADENHILRLAGAADYILIGEQHDNPGDHLAQAAFVDILARGGRHRPLLGLEMLPRRYYDFQLAAFSNSDIDLAELPEAVNWKNTWGYDFALYRPVFETARKYGLQLYGLNLPDSVRRSVARKGLSGLSEMEKSELPARIIPPLPEQREKLLAVFRMHAGMREKRTDKPAQGIPQKNGEPGTVPAVSRMAPAKAGKLAGTGNSAEAKGMFERFSLIQSLWDSTMAERAADIRHFARRSRAGRLAEGPPMVILAGAGHVEYGHGIASRIAVYDPGARILLVMPFSEESPPAGAADLYYYSEPVRKKSSSP